MPVATSTAILAAAALGAAGTAYAASRQAGGGGMSFVGPPKQLEGLMQKQYQRERGEVRQEGEFAKAGVGQKAVESGLGSTSFAGAMQTRVGKETEDRLLDLSQRYQMSRYGAYTPMVTGSPGPGPFAPLLQGFGQMAGMQLGQQMFGQQQQTAAAPSAMLSPATMSAFAAGTPYQQGLSGSSVPLQVASWYR